MIDLGATRRGRLPVALARAHGSRIVGEVTAFALPPLEARELEDLLVGAGFALLARRRSGDRLRVRARRLRTLPDWVGPRLRVLVCGLNPSLYSADLGVPFARPGNRFWPAALRTGLAEKDRDAAHALACGLGFTDCAKRATRRASDLRSSEYLEGVKRVWRLVERWRPRAVCFVGLDGFRKAVNRRAMPGWIDGGFGGCSAYLMPSTSGLNAHSRLADLVRHLRRAAAGE